MKLFNTMQNVGKVKYLVNFHDGIKTHSDGSMFFDLRTFKNKKEFEKCQKELKEDGYVYGDSSFKITKDNIHLYYEFMSDEDLKGYSELLNEIVDERFDYIEDVLNFKESSNYNSEDAFDVYMSSKLTLFGIKDTLKPIDEYIAEIKESSEYKKYIAS